MRKPVIRTIASETSDNLVSRTDQATTAVCAALAMATLMLMFRIAGIW